MHQKSKIQRSAVAVYILVSALFLLFFIYIAVFENTDVFQARDPRPYTVVTELSEMEIVDSSAPVGLSREYSWTLGELDAGENCLGFYLVHQYAQVWIEDQPVYSLMPDSGNRVCKGVSSNWVMIPLQAQDAGKQVRVVITPVYRSGTDFKVKFIVGSQLEIYLRQLKQDLPQILLAVLGILGGLFIMAVQVFLILRAKTKSWEIFYLGCFSMLLGIWKITDTRFTPLMFPDNPLALGYITIGMLFLSAGPLLFFAREHFPGEKHTLVGVMSLICCAVALGSLLCQVLGIAEFRQTLAFAHASIILTSVTLAVTVAVRMGRTAKAQNRWFENPIWILILGVASDLIRYYYNSSSSGVVYTLAAFLIYTAGRFVLDFLDINRMAKTDALTGLFNKSHWDQLMGDEVPSTGPVGLVMFDLNRLKQINDTLGHEMGDKALSGFSNILRNCIPRSNTICRWGGDEFTVMVTDATQEKLETCLREIRTAVDTYNASGEKPEIYYAAGYALSSQFPGLTRKQLLQIADERMYQDKQAWYQENEKASN